MASRYLVGRIKWCYKDNILHYCHLLDDVVVVDVIILIIYYRRDYSTSPSRHVTGYRPISCSRGGVIDYSSLYPRDSRSQYRSPHQASLPPRTPLVYGPNQTGQSLASSSVSQEALLTNQQQPITSRLSNFVSNQQTTTSQSHISDRRSEKNGEAKNPR